MALSSVRCILFWILFVFSYGGKKARSNSKDKNSSKNQKPASPPLVSSYEPTSAPSTDSNSGLSAIADLSEDSTQFIVILIIAAIIISCCTAFICYAIYRNSNKKRIDKTDSKTHENESSSKEQILSDLEPKVDMNSSQNRGKVDDFELKAPEVFGGEPKWSRMNTFNSEALYDAYDPVDTNGNI